MELTTDEKVKYLHSINSQIYFFPAELCSKPVFLWTKHSRINTNKLHKASYNRLHFQHDIKCWFFQFLWTTKL